jgi:dienelactone hydrolase
MYSALNKHVEDIDGATFALDAAANGRPIIRHDPHISSLMDRIGAYHAPQLLTEPLHFHHSDRDYYSPPEWNTDLVSRINAQGGAAKSFVYPGNTHALQQSPHDWFSEGEVVAGFETMLDRDLRLFDQRTGKAPIGSAEDLLSIDSLRRYAAMLRNEFDLRAGWAPHGDGQRTVAQFTADGLKQFALIIKPKGNPPPAGWPVLLMHHGYHPQPKNYGRISDGSTHRPGVYYRSVPDEFLRHGFLVVVPDFRGHNDSEGAAFTESPLAPLWYARDSIAAFRALGSLPQADISRVYLWGHSMGGPVTLRTLLALGDEVRAASIWSTGSNDIWKNAISQASAEDTNGEPVNSHSAALADLQAHIDQLPFSFSAPVADALPSIGQLRVPLNIHHALNDQTTPFSASTSLAASLHAHGLPFRLYSYAGANHLFEEQELKRAVAEDAQFFLRQPQSNQATDIAGSGTL